ncbi:hypothetical protein [Micromonospora inyonensis]|uniref:hypothetical protein n=1 Tax=Micromonospora inyonensis TaxID=47866 RepID=UPI000B89E042|nr:hypothetical protein [Micromonospora inyonensis]
MPYARRRIAAAVLGESLSNASCACQFYIKRDRFHGGGVDDRDQQPRQHRPRRRRPGEPIRCLTTDGGEVDQQQRPDRAHHAGERTPAGTALRTGLRQCLAPALLGAGPIALGTAFLGPVSGGPLTLERVELAGPVDVGADLGGAGGGDLLGGQPGAGQQLHRTPPPFCSPRHGPQLWRGCPS